MVPFLDLKQQYQSIKAELDAAVAGVLDSAHFILGPEVAAFEREFAAYCQADHAVAVNSGTSALHLALLAAGIGEGDEVITTPFTFAATVAAIYYCGAKPVYVDIDPATFNIDPTLIAQTLTPRTKAVVPVHLYGYPADMDAILSIARSRGIAVIEDAAQAHGAQYNGRPVGALGDLGVFSFYPGKNLGAFGEGGAVVTNNSEHAERVRKLRDWGSSRRYYHEVKGFNYRLEGLQGAVLRVKLRYLPQWVERRRANAALYNSLLKDIGVLTPNVAEGYLHAFNVYTIRGEARDNLNGHLNQAGIQTAIYYPVPLYLQEAYAEPEYGPGLCPEAERASREVLSLPIFPELTPAQIHTVCSSIRELSLDHPTI